jgi:DNA-binding IclR family transcriptional regulator
MESTSLVKALGLLEALAGEPDGRSLAALATEVGLAKPTAHRILKTLTALGYLERTATGVYRQTPQMNRLISSEQHRHVLELAEPILRALHEKTRETVNLGVLRYDQIVYLQVLESTQPLRRVATKNSVDPFYSTALGRAIASHLPETQRTSLVNVARLKQRTTHTNIDRKSLVGILDQAASDGYAMEVDETDVGVTCIGAPILEQGIAIAAISLSVPTARATGDALVGLIAGVRRAATVVSDQLKAARKKSAKALPKLTKSRRSV